MRCRVLSHREDWAASPIACRTSFYLVDRKLSLFVTEDPRFVNAFYLHGQRNTGATDCD